MSHGSRKHLPAKVFQEYLENLTLAQSYHLPDSKNWDLLRCYAELQFKLNGGAKCPQCRSHVRHVIPVTVEKENGALKEFPCLCTRCFEGERATAVRVVLQLGEARVEYRPRDYGKKVAEADKAASKTKPTSKT